MACRYKPKMFWYNVLSMFVFLSPCVLGGYLPPVPCYFIFGASSSDNGNDNDLSTTAKANLSTLRDWFSSRSHRKVLQWSHHNWYSRSPLNSSIYIISLAFMMIIYYFFLIMSEFWDFKEENFTGILYPSIVFVKPISVQKTWKYSGLIFFTLIFSHIKVAR